MANDGVEALADFHRRYWRAWDDSDLDGVAACLDDDFLGTFLGPEGAPAIEVDRAGVLEILEQTFAQYRQTRAGWRRSGVIVLDRGNGEAVATMRVDALFPDHPDWNNAELTLEAYRQGPDGQWRISRVHSERLR